MLRLANVQTYAKVNNVDTLVKDYRLAYDISAATQRSRLTTLTECAGDGTCLLPATTMGWKDSATGFTPQTLWLSNDFNSATGWNNENIHPRPLADVNGDGKVDIIGFASDGVRVSTNQPFSDILTSLTTDLGTITGPIVYKPLTDNSIYAKGSGGVYPYVNIQAPLYVVSSATTPDGIGGTRSTNYFYYSAKSHLTGGGFLGFFRVDATDSLTGIKTSTSFRQDYPYQGLPTITTQTQANGLKLKQVTNTWGFTTYPDTVIPVPPNTFATTNGSKHHFAAITATKEETKGLSGEVLPQVNTSTTYDAYGNAKTMTTTTSDGFSKTVTNTYAPPDLAKWFLGQLTRSTVASTANAATLTRTSAFTYNTVNGLLSTETIEPDNAALRLDTSYTFDVFGNKKTATVIGTGIVSRSSTTTYDTKGRFPVSASNALGHAETRVFDPKFGNVTSVTGPNNLTSNFVFDGWGRPTTESGPDGVVTTTTRSLCSSNCPYLGAYTVAISKPGAPTVTAYFDKFNRELRRSSPGFDGRLIYKDTEYDNLSHVSRVSRPYYAGDAIVTTTFGYDLLNRTTSETDALGKTSYFNYYGLTTTSTNPLGQKRISVKNSQGQLMNVTDTLNNVIRYSYDPFGNLLTTTDPANNVTSLSYDLRGRKIAMNDPDMGAWSYTYNVLGELLTQIDAKLQVTTNTYDVLGRMTRRAEPDLITTWTYDTAAKGIGKLATVVTDNGQARSFSYDTLGRQINTTHTIGTTTLNAVINYDDKGRVDSQINPAGLQVQNVYNANGYLSQIRNSATLQVYWTATNLSADGQLTDGIFSNGVVEGRTIDMLGRTTAVTAAHTLGTVTLLNYTYDPLGNLKIRTDTAQNLTETLGYDALNRLTSVSSSNVNQAAKSMQYDSLGNITYKSDAGTYTYNPGGAGSVRPHAVTSVAGAWNASFQYDANGNMTTSADRTVTYTSFNLPTTITQNSQTTTLLYGANHERIKQTDPDGKVTLTLNPRLDLGAHYDQITHPSGVVEKISYLYAGSRPIGIYSTNANGVNGSNTLRYLHVDAQGSIVAITSGDSANAGAVIERLSYDAWGKRRNPGGTDSNVNIYPQTTDHGYTGHMHLDNVGLIHMNGRVYDPRLGRFMQADPNIQSPANLQSFNRYTYVLNNPFMYTDPSGYFSFRRWVENYVKFMVAPTPRNAFNYASSGPGMDQINAALMRSEIFRTAAGIAAAAYGGPFGAAAFSGYMAGLSGGSASDMVRAGAISFGTSMAFKAAGDIAPSGVGNVVGHAVVGCASAEASGGNCGNGAAAAAAGSAWSNYGIKSSSFEANLIMHAAVGGTASVLGGGKFENGAKTAAFGYLFNECGHGDGCGGYKLKTGVPPPSSEIDQLLNCTASCANENLRVTSTSDSHGPNNPHTRGLAVDVTTKNPTIVMQCAANCGAVFQLNEYSAPSLNATGGHLHFQLVPGRGGITGPYYPKEVMP